MHWTPFAGLTALDPGDSIASDGGSFLYRNPDVTDYFVRIGAVGHRHDQHAGLANPTAPMSAEAVGSGGALEADTSYALTYTVVDENGGETLGASALVASTGGTTDTPTVAPSAVADYTQGIMPAGDYYYALTYTDGQGGETPLGPYTLVTIAPGHASGAVDLSGLATELAPSGLAVNWRLWRSDDASDWHLVLQGATDTYLDAGFDPPDNPAIPPATNTTGGIWSLVLTLPTTGEEPALADPRAVAVNVYLAPDVGFANPSFYGQLALPDAAGASVVITQDATSQGAPPRVSTSIPGAHQIFPDTELQFGLKEAVAASGMLGAGVQGDARVTLDTEHLWGVVSPSGAVSRADWIDLSQLWIDTAVSQADIEASITVAGPGDGSAWETTARFTGASGSIADFAVLTGEGAMTVTNGVLTTADPTEVRWGLADSEHPDGPWAVGDKYAAQWTAPGVVGDGTRLRAHIVALSGVGRLALVVNMADRSTGLAFWFEGGNAGWTTNLDLIGGVEYTAYGSANTYGQDAVALFAGRTLVDVSVTNTDFWIEVTRDGNTITGAIYAENPAGGGVRPAATSTYDVTEDPVYGPTAPAGYYGIAFEALPDQRTGAAELDLATLEPGELILHGRRAIDVVGSGGIAITIVDLAGTTRGADLGGAATQIVIDGSGGGGGGGGGGSVSAAGAVVTVDMAAASAGFPAGVTIASDNIGITRDDTDGLLCLPKAAGYDVQFQWSTVSNLNTISGAAPSAQTLTSALLQGLLSAVVGGQLNGSYALDSAALGWHPANGAYVLAGRTFMGSPYLAAGVATGCEAAISAAETGLSIGGDVWAFIPLPTLVQTVVDLTNASPPADTQLSQGIVTILISALK